MITHRCFQLCALALVLLCLVLPSIEPVSAKRAIAEETNCIPDQDSCEIGPGCPLTCCTGVPARENGGYRRCIAASPFNMIDLNTDTPASVNSTDTSNTPASEPVEEPSPAPVAPVPTAATPISEPAAPTEQGDKLQTTTSTTGNKKSSKGAVIGIVIAAIVACLVMLTVVIYKRKTINAKRPGSAYIGRGTGGGLTPDNRTLANASPFLATQSMKQLPASSLASRQDASLGASPFSGTMRMSSPTQRGASNQDITFSESTCRAGSAVHVKHRETHGVVAL